MYTEKPVLVRKIFTNGLNVALPLKPDSKRQPWCKKSKVKSSMCTVIKEGDADSLLGHERTHHH